jgi:hypothetical protein
VTADDEFLRAAQQALQGGAGDAALDGLGWWQLLSDLGDADTRAAVFTLFRAQGRELASSTALGALMAQPYLEFVGGEPGSVVTAIVRDSPSRGAVLVVVGDPAGKQLLIDQPDQGAAVLDAADADLRPVDVPGRLELHEATVGPLRGKAVDDAVRARSVFLGRVALALEILGAAEGAVALAIEHARAREQFGQPIGTFQAVRHLLAWATTDCTAVEAVAAEAVALDSAAPPRYGDIAKALAGRNGRRACERALQVLGAIGFTAEHDHHHFHSRVLALDALLGTSAWLTRDLGAWRREHAGDLQMPSAMLLAR